MRSSIKLYKTQVKPVLMYGCETWKMNEGNAQKINVFQNRCLRRILKIKWQDKVTNRELLERANIERLSEEVRRRRWRFIGLILRKNPDNDCATALSWAPEGKRKRGRPKTTWRRTVERERTKAGWQSWKRCEQQHTTGTIGELMCRPYAPRWRKRTRRRRECH